MTPPVLVYADYTKPFILYIDANHDGLGAGICQEKGGLERAIAYVEDWFNTCLG